MDQITQLSVIDTFYDCCRQNDGDFFPAAVFNCAKLVRKDILSSQGLCRRWIRSVKLEIDVRQPRFFQRLEVFDIAADDHSIGIQFHSRRTIFFRYFYNLWQICPHGRLTTGYLKRKTRPVEMPDCLYHPGYFIKGWVWRHSAVKHEADGTG